MRPLLVAFAVAACACTGAIADGEGQSDPASVEAPLCDGRIEPGASPVRRLTRFEYEVTVRDLLGTGGELAREFASEEVVDGFGNNAAALNVSPVLAEQYAEAAETLAKSVKLEEVLPCDPVTAGDEACARAFVDRFAERAFRRPLSSEEKSRLFGVYVAGKDEGRFEDGVRAVIEVVLQSPQFLYRLEPAAGAGDAVPVSGYELASRLSYFLWGSMPDDVLRSAAREGRLVTTDDIAAQAKRMLADGRTRKMVSSFHAQWLGIDRLPNVSKSKEMFPEWNDGIRTSMAEETRLFLDSVFWGDGRVESLFTSNVTFLDAKLAHFYGVWVPPASGFVRVVFPAEQRMGLLTQGSILSIYAKANQTSPVARGKFVRERLLCQPLTPPPMSLMVTAPEPKAGTTTRERYAEHVKNPTCAGCHKYTDAIGFGFERWDAVGKYRTTENDLPVDSTGTLSFTDDADGPFDGAIELGAKLSQSAQVRSCLVTQWFRFAYGRKETEGDRCTLDQLTATLESNGHDMRGLLVALTQAAPFTHKKSTGGAP